MSGDFAENISNMQRQSDGRKQKNNENGKGRKRSEYPIPNNTQNQGFEENDDPLVPPKNLQTQSNNYYRSSLFQKHQKPVSSFPWEDQQADSTKSTTTEIDPFVSFSPPTKESSQSPAGHPKNNNYNNSSSSSSNGYLSKHMKRRNTPPSKRICKLPGCGKECPFDYEHNKFFSFCTKEHAKLHQEEEDLKMAKRMQAEEEEQGKYIPQNHSNGTYMDEIPVFEDQFFPEDELENPQDDSFNSITSQERDDDSIFENNFLEAIQPHRNHPWSDNLDDHLPEHDFFTNTRSLLNSHRNSTNQYGSSTSSHRGRRNSSNNSGSRPVRGTMVPPSILFQNFIDPLHPLFEFEPDLEETGFSLGSRLILPSTVPPEIRAALMSGSSADSYEALLNLAELIGDAKPKGADAGTIDSTTARGKISNSELQGLQQDCKECVICKEEFHEGEDVRRLPCLHVFHTECVDEWLKRNKSCPICKMLIDEGATAQIGEDGSVSNDPVVDLH